MFDSAKYRIKPLKDKRDYNLSCIRVPAEISAKGLYTVFEPTLNGDKELNSKNPCRQATQ